MQPTVTNLTQTRFFLVEVYWRNNFWRKFNFILEDFCSSQNFKQFHEVFNNRRNPLKFFGRFDESY